MQEENFNTSLCCKRRLEAKWVIQILKSVYSLPGEGIKFGTVTLDTIFAQAFDKRPV